LTLLTELLTANRNVAVDNTNPSISDRRGLLAIAREYGAHTVAYWFPPDRDGSVARNAARPPKTRVPDVGLYDTLKRLMGPHPAERFDSVYVVRFDGEGGFTVE
jgi:predicted kinase